MLTVKKQIIACVVSFVVVDRLPFLELWRCFPHFELLENSSARQNSLSFEFVDVTQAHLMS